MSDLEPAYQTHTFWDVTSWNLLLPNLETFFSLNEQCQPSVHRMIGLAWSKLNTVQELWKWGRGTRPSEFWSKTRLSRGANRADGDSRDRWLELVLGCGIYHSSLVITPMAQLKKYPGNNLAMWALRGSYPGLCVCRSWLVVFSLSVLPCVSPDRAGSLSSYNAQALC